MPSTKTRVSASELLLIPTNFLKKPGFSAILGGGQGSALSLQSGGEGPGGVLFHRDFNNKFGSLSWRTHTA